MAGGGWGCGIPHGIFHTRPLPNVQFVCCNVPRHHGTLCVLPVSVAVYLGSNEEKRKADKDNSAKKRRGKSDTKDDTKYDDEEDVLPLTDAALGGLQQEQRRLAAVNTATISEAHCLKFIQRSSHPNQQMKRRKDPVCRCCIYYSVQVADQAGLHHLCSDTFGRWASSFMSWILVLRGIG